MRSDDPLREPWSAFLNDLDLQLTQSTEIHCLGGFVVSELYGLQRPTADVDILETAKGTDPATLARLAGREANFTGATGSTLFSRSSNATSTVIEKT